jgi:hypothetical protein
MGARRREYRAGGDFVGFSIEMSVSNQVCESCFVFSALGSLPTLSENGGSRDGKLTKAAVGKNATHIQVPFLNLMANIQQRAGSVRVRVRGNSQVGVLSSPSFPSLLARFLSSVELMLTPHPGISHPHPRLVHPRWQDPPKEPHRRHRRDADPAVRV